MRSRRRMDVEKPRLTLEKKLLIGCYAGTVPLVVGFLNHITTTFGFNPIFTTEGVGQWFLDILLVQL